MAQMTDPSKPWLQSYQLGPYKLEPSLAHYPEVPLFRLLDQAAEQYPTQTAILFQERALKYHQLKREVDRLASALARLGLEKGDRACLFLPNCLEYSLAYWAVLRAGGVVVPTSILRTQEALERLLAAREACDLETIVVTSSAGYDVEAIAGALPPGVAELRGLLQQEDRPVPEARIDPRQDLCELAFTGGATGVPKGVMLTHSNPHTSF